AEPGQGPQHRLGDLHQHVEAADLVRYIRPQLLEYLGVKRRAVGGEAAHRQAPPVQLGLELSQESAEVSVAGLVVEDAEGQAVVAAVIDDGQHAAGAVVQLVDGQVAGEVGQRLVQVGGLDGV